MSVPEESLPPGVYCGECRGLLREIASLPFEQREPCPACGSLRRLHSVHLAGYQPAAKNMLGLKARHGQRGKVAPHYEVKVGNNFDRDTGRWLEMEQVVDHENDRYRKRLVDVETGQVIRDENKSLREHKAHTWRKSQ